MSDPDTGLASLVRLAQKGDEDAVSRLITETQGDLFRFCLYLSGSEAMAEDLCQETYLRVLERIRDVRNPASFRFWLLKTARNFFLDQVRGVRGAGADELIEAREAGAAASDPASEDIQIHVRESLRALDPDDRSVLLLVDLEGRSYSEAAEMIGISEDAVRSRLHRARKAFGKKFFAD